MKITSRQIFVTYKPDHSLTQLVILIPLQLGGGVASQTDAVDFQIVAEVIPEVGLADCLSISPQHWDDGTV